MKKFNLEQAKAGNPVMSKKGEPVRILCFDRQNPEYPLVGLIQHEDGGEELKTYTSDGKVLAECDTDSDLCMKPVYHEKWVNIYWDENLEVCIPGAIVFDSETKAKQEKSPYKHHVATAKVEWEDD